MTLNMKTAWQKLDSGWALLAIAVFATLGGVLLFDLGESNREQASQLPDMPPADFQDLSITKSARLTPSGPIEERATSGGTPFVTAEELRSARYHLSHRLPLQVSSMSYVGLTEFSGKSNDLVSAFSPQQPSNSRDYQPNFPDLSNVTPPHLTTDGLKASIGVRRGEGLIKTLRNLGVQDENIKEVVPVIAANYTSILQPQDNLAATWKSEDEHMDNAHLEQVSIYSEDKEVYRAIRRDAEGFSSLSDPATPAPLPPKALKLGEALSLELMAWGVPRLEVARLLFLLWDRVDLSQKVGLSDAFVAILEKEETETPSVGYLRLSSEGQTFEAYRVQSSEGDASYFDRSGHQWGSGLIAKPMEVGRLSSTFGRRIHPITKARQFHAGRDMAAPSGTKVFAARDGRVEIAGPVSGYGNMVQLTHSQKLATRYAHMGRIVDGLKPGDAVEKGQLMGFVGSSGLSTGSHLHFEVREADNPIDPARANEQITKSIHPNQRRQLQMTIEEIDDLLKADRPSITGTHV